ncbi:cAMP-regulated phosphoprotein 19 isoform X2 [Aethina tumida]|nr:cAMP-regulated phosphoprotein 19 isoform X2 [Aethina tumida]XP_049822692.1 cAMP-regulated phosphoprotein 19 isoform X2 [Aethina tumida]
MSEQEQEAQSEMSPHELEKMEEAKLKAKYPAGPMGPPGQKVIGGHSAFLQKRLAKGQKFFDSGDYQMAKQKIGGVNKLPSKPTAPFATGEAIPTPETVPARKTSIVQPSKLSSNVS